MWSLIETEKINEEMKNLVKCAPTVDGFVKLIYY